MHVGVYTSPGSLACHRTKKALDRYGVHYEVYDVTEDAAAARMVQSLGYSELPVVYVRDTLAEPEHWCGYRPEEINELVRFAADTALFAPLDKAHGSLSVAQ
ncbi:glutaredoxin family protein [Hoyosella sp. YIM 151337]|uniref:glutaredoxin family protein n=1 Tax=Hoyosella sp. YIM 151337 TaxID=2992742 RepID=UPI0022369E76|nr:glutaredoxin family protein [Hoyosella sp. YIM 151337]MCW4351854.1 glutaredoxin family protein [Hoyosella sp. YIM 151337]